MSRRIRTQIPPRGLDRIEAASYVGIGTELFDRGVSGGMLPQPRLIFSRLVWDLDELDQAFDAIPHRGEDVAPSPVGENAASSERASWLRTVK